jgi:membrane protease YdiL (CAAX protease family)
MNSYLEIARQGRNEWWRYLLSVGLILFMWIIVGSLPALYLGAISAFDNNPETAVTGKGFVGFGPLLIFVIMLTSFIPLFLATIFAVRYIHGRPVRTLITAFPAIRWGRMAAGFGVWLGLSVLMSLMEEILYPGRYVLTFQPASFLAFLLPALFLLGIQTSAEEIFLRGYLMQGLGLVIRPGWIVAMISATVFAALHWSNPEVATSAPLLMLYYFSFGLFAALIILVDGGLELALGVHAANNLFSALIANYVGSAIQSPSIFTNSLIDPVFGLVAPLIGMGVFFLVFFVWKKSRQLTEPVQP